MSVRMEEERKKSQSEERKTKILSILDEGDKDFPDNPGMFSSKDSTEFEKLYNDVLKNQEFKVGDIVKGRVVDVRNDFVIVDINYKSEGVISKSEFRLLENQEIEVGQEVEVYIDRIENENGVVVLSKDKADINKAWNDIIKATENNEIVKGTVIAQVKGGLSVDIGVRAFLPGSQLDIHPVRNMKPYIGQTYDFKVIKVSQKRGNIVLSRRVILEQDRENLPKSGDIQENAIVKGIVKNIRDYGVFIDLGEVDGLLHITDMSWSRLNHPSDLMKLGEEVKVKVLKIDKEKNRISLGLKQLKEEEWGQQASQFSIGSVEKGKVVSFADYGAFVALRGGLEGLVHLNEMAWTKKIKNPSQVLEVGQEVEVKVIDIQKESHKLSLSIKQLQENPWSKLKDKYKMGQILKGSIASISDFGLFVTIEEGIDGLVHVSDLSWTENVTPAEKYKIGQEVEVKVLDINSEEEKFSLGIKQLERNPWDVIEEKYPIGSRHKVKVVRIVEFGAFVKLQDDIEGLIHISELSRDRVKHPSDVVKEGEEVVAEIITIDSNSKKIGFSIRLVESEGEFSSAAPGAKTSSGFMDNIFAKVLKKSISNAEAEGGTTEANDTQTNDAETSDAETDGASSTQETSEEDKNDSEK